MKRDNVTSGSTVRLSASFYDFNEKLVDPDILKLIFYNYKYEIINEIALGTQNRLSVGKYYYDYKTENSLDKDHVIYEWNADIQGNISIKRDDFSISFFVK